ncbi:hypothetical protein ES708_08456 [subsurface metagenome]
MKRTIQIKVNGIELKAILNNSRIAQAIWGALPIVARINTWGDEVYFTIPAKLELEKGQELVEIGDLGYWPPGSAFCIFFGPTPMSREEDGIEKCPCMLFLAKGERTLALVGSNPAPATKKYRGQEVDQQVSPAFLCLIHSPWYNISGRKLSSD